MVKTNRGNWQEIFEHTKKNTTEILTFPGKPYSIAVFPQVYGTLTEDQFYQELANIIIKEARMKCPANESDQNA